jgi:integrase
MGVRNRSSVRTEIRDGRKILIVDFRFTDKDGRPRRYRRDASVQTAAGARAEAERLKRMAASRGTLDADPLAPTLAAFVEGDFTKLVMVRFKPSTRHGYEQLLDMPEHGLLALLGRKRLDAIGAADARVVEADALSRKAKPRYSLVCLRTVLRSAVELGVLATMPRLPRLPAKSEKLPAAPPLAVVVQTIAAADGWLRVAIALAALAGLRCGEVRALEVRDVDLDAKHLIVRRAFSADEVCDPKGRDERAVPVTPLLASVLAEACEGKGPRARLASDARGEALREAAIGGAWRRLQGQLGIEPAWRFHQLRHFFGSTCLRGGGNVEAVRRLLGHKDLASTTRYVHATERDVVAAVAALPGAGQ